MKNVWLERKTRRERLETVQNVIKNRIEMLRKSPDRKVFSVDIKGAANSEKFIADLKKVFANAKKLNTDVKQVQIEGKMPEAFKKAMEVANAKARIDRLEELKLQVMAQNPSNCGVTLPVEQKPAFTLQQYSELRKAVFPQEVEVDERWNAPITDEDIWIPIRPKEMVAA